MRSIRLFCFILLIILLVTTTCYANEKVIFEMKDAVEDDYGPGSYIYPQDSQFRNNNGLFDLTYFKVVEGTDNYIFQFRFREITNPWQAKYGFSHQLIQIYIDNSDGGSRETFKQGANLKFEEQHPWNHLIKITGWNVEYFTVTNQAKEYNILRAAEVKLEQDDLIKVIIPRDQLGDLSETYYYVLIGSLDGFSYDNYRKVTAEGGDWNFSGGTDTELNPNVIDTLVPEGLSQKQVLGSFDLEEGELATLRAVGPELALSWKLVIIFAFSAVFLITFIGIVIKFIKTKLFNELD